MPFLRLAVIFGFFAFSFARAACADFEIFANQNSLGCNPVVSVGITYGDTLKLSISPATGDIKWRATDIVIIGTEYVYIPILIENIAQTITYFVERNGVSKTINVNLHPSYIVSFNTDGGMPSISPQRVRKDELAQRPTETLTKTGYDFDGWDFDFNTPITKDITIKAKWKIKVFIVSFNSGSGSAVASQNVNYNSTASTPPPPTKTNYDFDGWLLNSSKYNFSTPVTEDIALNANWIPHPYSIIYNTDGGICASCPASYTIESPLITLHIPAKKGYEFNGWFDNSGFSGTAITAIPTGSTGNKDFYAKWTLEIYSITYNPNGATMIPASPPTSYNVNSPAITMPAFNERCGYRFDGWFDNPGYSGTAITVISTGSTGNKTFYAKWTNTPNTPTISMLSYSQPSTQNKIYDGSPITPITASSTSACPMGAITILYGDSEIEPKNVGNYQVHASIEANESYTAAKILLGILTISKANATFNISATVSDKEYDGTTAATIKSIAFTPIAALYGTDNLTASDYSATANFSDLNAGTHNVSVNVAWLNGPLSQNYNLAIGTIAPISATIAKAANTLLEIEAENYELSAPGPNKITVRKSPYISDSDVRIEYKREGEESYVSIARPNRIGNWNVRATIDGNANYEGKTAEASFVVTRGSATTIIHNVEFATGFNFDQALSGRQRRYFVAGASLCKIKDTKIQVTVREPDIILRIKNIPQRGIDDEGLIYEIPFAFGKPGLDTLIYELLSKDNKYKESDTILIETPIPFETVVGQKWNNVLYVNNNKQTNGGYEFYAFEWFKNNDTISISDLQFYSAGPSSLDILDTNDIYKATMRTKDGIRISTCEGKAKTKEVTAQPAKPALKKQVLGIVEKSLNSGSKVYNLNGKLTKETPAGVYIVEE